MFIFVHICNTYSLLLYFYKYVFKIIQAKQDWIPKEAWVVHTGEIRCEEASCVDAAVCAELDVQLIAGSVDIAWELCATESGQLWSTAAVSIKHLKTRVMNISSSFNTDCTVYNIKYYGAKCFIRMHCSQLGNQRSKMSWTPGESRRKTAGVDCPGWS